MRLDDLPIEHPHIKLLLQRNVVVFFSHGRVAQFSVLDVQNLISTFACPRIRDPRLTRGDKTLGQMSTCFRIYDDV